MELPMSKQEIKDLKKIIKIQEKIIAANKDEIKYYKHINHYLMHECFDIWEKNWSTKVHNVDVEILRKQFMEVVEDLESGGKMFQNNTLDSPKRWLDAGYRVFPCQEKRTPRTLENRK